MVDGKAAIAVLGPQRAGEDDGLCPEAESLAGALASAGYLVVTAGAGDVSRSVVQGTLRAGGRVLAILEPDDGASDLPIQGEGVELLRRPTGFQCLESTLECTDAIVAFAGDLSALATLLQVWAYGHTPNQAYRPLILLGEPWPAIVKVLADAADLDGRSRAMLTFANTVEEAVESLRYYIAPAV